MPIPSPVLTPTPSSAKLNEKFQYPNPDVLSGQQTPKERASVKQDPHASAAVENPKPQEPKKAANRKAFNLETNKYEELTLSEAEDFEREFAVKQ